jgi:replication factor A1
MSEEENKKKIIDLKPGEEHVHVSGRVLESSEPHQIQTRRGIRTISNAVIGDETGRVQATLWGSKAGTLEEGKVVDIKGAWTTAYRGKVQLNIGKSTEITEKEDTEAPAAEEIPEAEPTAPEDYRPPRRQGFRSQRRRYVRQGGGF